MFISETPIRVRYEETDQMGVVYHSKFIVWMDVARTEFLREIGYAYAELEKGGVTMAVVDLHVKYLSPAHYDEIILVKTKISKLTPIRIFFDYEMFHQESGKKIIQSQVVLASLDQNKRPTPMKGPVFESLKQAATQSD